MPELSYKDEIEALQSERDYESKGDALYIEHEDEEARLEWAFYRPSGSHPRQIQDKSHIVAIMAFNHSRLGALERFNLLSPQIINSDVLRNKIRNRSRMLFRAMIDDDFSDLVSVLQKYPVFFDLANDQMINGRIWNESYANAEDASKFLFLNPQSGDEKLLEGVKRRLKPLKSMNIDEAKMYLELLENQVQNLHSYVKEHYAKEFEMWMAKTTLHPLQKVLWQKKINLFKDV
ncbi:MAG: hypothetical protein FP820_10155 [Sulfurimonas sp.]|nr:hypothetical protein [Sulfurimonas sp.]MBU3939654.1 hypothetical protein [bacterium]MBU4025393.1 hypothetical protein [bacterium]MBU4058140.1 hypothetical protein [bacterium]MBU4110577.1 hypothetical protein [bacterium]